MIFSECPKCNEPFIYPYESGEKPYGKGVFGEIDCENCKSELMVERISFCGETWVKEDLLKEHPELKEIK